MYKGGSALEIDKVCNGENRVALEAQISNRRSYRLAVGQTRRVSFALSDTHGRHHSTSITTRQLGALAAHQFETAAGAVISHDQYLALEAPDTLPGDISSYYF